MSAKKQPAKKQPRKDSSAKNVFAYSKPFQRGEDTTSYRLVSEEIRQEGQVRRQAGPRRGPERALAPRVRGDARRVVPPPAEAPAAGRRDPEGPRGLAERPLHGDDAAPQRGGLGEVRAAVLPGHGHGDGRGLEGPAGLDGSRRRRAHLERDLEDLHRGEPPLFADGRAHDVRGGQHRQQPAGADRHLRDAGHGVQAALRREGRRLGEQERPLPGDEGAPEPSQPRSVPRREDEEPRHGGVPSVPHRDRRRRHVRRSLPEDGEARLDGLLRLAPDDGRRLRPRVPRSGAGEEAAREGAEARLRSAVRRQVLRARHPGHPPAAARRVLPGGNRRLVLGRPQRPREDRREGPLARGARTPPRGAPPRLHGRRRSTRAS